jgi:hypothetical protein
MSDTPESNKAKIAFTSLFANDDAYWVPFKVSCKLERERDIWIAEAERWRKNTDLYHTVLGQRDRLAEAIRKHRDELELTSGDSVDRILWNTLEVEDDDFQHL